MNPKPTPSRNRGREPFRYLAVAGALEKEIAAGRYQLGEKLPSERDLAERMEVSYLTMRQGVDVLVRKGLVRRELGSGTYINALRVDPMIAILFGPSVVEESAHFYRALLTALEEEFEQRQYACRCYAGFNLHEADQPEGAPPCQQLLRDSRSHPIQAAITISLRDEQWLKLAPLKGVPLASHSEVVADVRFDFACFGERALEECVARGCRDVVYLRHFLTERADLKGLTRAAKRLQVPLPEIVSIVEDERPMDEIAHATLLDHLRRWKGQGRRPDALIISDDIATRGAAIAVIKEQIAVPQEILLITLASEGIEHHYGVEVKRYETSSRELASHLVKVLEQRLAGEQPKIPIVIEGDWSRKLPRPSLATTLC